MREMESLLLRETRRLKLTAWWVGGAVRDEAMRRPCLDGDLACRQALKLARAVHRKSGGTLITLDDAYQIYRIVLPGGGRMLDFAELHGGTIERDLARRDFSINAMARKLGDETIVDPFGGLKDLRAKRIRALSAKVLKDDPLRRLRAFRFSAQLDFSIDSRTLNWIGRGTFGTVAGERLREEFLKLLGSPRAGAGLKAMDKAGLLTELLPELESCRRTAVRYYGRGGVLTHSLHSVENLEWIFERSPAPIQSYLAVSIGGHPRAAWMKLGALLHDIGKPGTAKVIKGRLRFFGHEELGADLIGPLGSRLRLSRQETQIVRLWVKHHMRLGSLASAPAITPKAIFRYFRDLGEEGLGMVLVSLADHYDYLARRKWGKNTDPVEKLSRTLIPDVLRAPAHLRPERLIDGHDIMRALKIKPSPIIGLLLEKVQEAQVEGLLKTRADALAALPKLYRSSKREISAQARSDGSTLA